MNDGSRDRTLEKLFLARSRYNRIKIVNLSRNFGKEAAMTAGFDMCSGHVVVPIDADLQDPPELIEEMLGKWREGYDVVYGKRTSRESDSKAKRFTASIFYRIINMLSSIVIPENAGDFRLMDRKVIEALRDLPEKNRFMKGLFAWVGFRQTELGYSRQARTNGQSKWNYWRLWNFAIDGVTAFSTAPLRIWTYVGLVVALCSFIYAGIIFFRTLIHGVDVPGYASLMIVILFFNGLQMVTFGVFGEYIGRLYQEIKSRPIYVIDSSFGFNDKINKKF